ncbi:hypothetical protein JJ685_24545 [Ramlibacter monticola]|uniref:Uncharacterized protein n=1 Tax=Ramlibacter monticola TaxID=1926872 RepID=A0A936Z4R1_9BURK|nr:hypothetical protein [Ramlibacter monticola]MBL0394332.1 hypothetical protein [Ramlibacter monticola]
MTTTTYTVKTRDLGGSTSRNYKTRKAAIARFEEMLGYSMAAAIEEAFYTLPADQQPTPDTVKRVQGVSHHGTAVIFVANEHPDV